MKLFKTSVGLTTLLLVFLTAPAAKACLSARADATGAIDSTSSKRALAVIAMSNEIENADWRDARVGMGLRVILSQLFFDSGYFSLLEEKPEIRQKLNELAAGIWALNKNDYDFAEEINKTAELGADFVVYGKVYYFGKPKTKGSLGPIHVSRNAVVIKVEVTFQDLKTGRIIKAKGEGESATTAGSAVFEFREDRVEMDKTNIGNATKKALDEAVEKIIKEFKKKYGS
jgi:curli biogenesis system outer membrane secretion channel CsgG